MYLITYGRKDIALSIIILEVDPTSALVHIADGKIEIRQLTPDQCFTGPKHETDRPEGARELPGQEGATLLSHGVLKGINAQGNKCAQVTARLERSHVSGFENGPSRLPRVI